MDRVAYKNLLSWKRSKDRKPLLVQGARQVGKTYLIKSFGEKEYEDLWYLNFEQTPHLRSLFLDSLEPKKIIENIGLFLGKSFRTKKTLIFFDEIQIAPEAITSLKYFYEQAPEYHIIAAGSLLGVSVGQHRSFPVGKVSFLTLYPMNFQEYLWAIQERALADTIALKKDYEALPKILHEKLLRHTKLFFFLGGMPEVVQHYIRFQDIAQARQIQNDILNAYARDFSKYADRNQSNKISQIWQSLPYQLAKENKKFKYSQIQKKGRAAIYQAGIEWLKKAGLIQVVPHISTAKLPLAGYADNTKFKIYLLDCGLLGAMLQLESTIIIHGNSLFSEYNGAFTENFVANELVSNGIKNLFYWTSGNKAEVDFVLQKGKQIIPIEVKSGLGKNLKSLRSFQSRYSSPRIFRISPRNYIQTEGFFNIPLYTCHPRMFDIKINN